MRTDLAGTDVTDFADIAALTPNADDLGEQIGNATIVLEEESDLGAVLAREPRHKDEVRIYDDDTVTLRFGGYVSSIASLSRPGLRRAWRVTCQDWNVRTLETATGSLNRAAVTTNDRQHVIAIFTDALFAQTFAAGTGLAEAIYTANAPDWTGIQATAFLYGKDWSYMTTKQAMDSLTAIVPGVSWRIDVDKIVRYGLLRGTPAPFDLHTDPEYAYLEGYEDWTEEVRTAGHFNKARRGGEGAAEQTFFDEVSYQRSGHLIIDSAYRNDETVPASDLRRRTYAEGKLARIRRTATTTITEPGVKAGQVIYVANQRLGTHRNIDHAAPMVNPLRIMGRSRSGRLAQGARGRFLVQKVERKPLGAGLHEYRLQLGDAKRDLPTQLAVLSGAQT